MANIGENSDTQQAFDLERLALLEAQVRGEVEQVLGYARTESQTLELHEVERGLFRSLLALGLTLLRFHLAARGTGERGPAFTRAGQRFTRHSLKSKTYLSVFGLLKIDRTYYWSAGFGGDFPLDAGLNLPKQRYSYLLQEWGTLLASGGAFEAGSRHLKELLGVSFWSQGLQSATQKLSTEVDDYYQGKPPPRAEDEGEILVAALDGKGVRMRRPASRLPRSKGGVQPKKKKEAVVTALYTIDFQPRTKEEILREINADAELVRADQTQSARPKPRNKQLRATFSGKEQAAIELRRQMDQRDPEGTKDWVALTDGDKSLHRQVRDQLGDSDRVTLILDLMHALEYLWEAGHAFWKAGTAEAARWVTGKLSLLLEGKVGYVIGCLRRSLNEYQFTKSGKKSVEAAIRYFSARREFMAYDVYLRRGYPIGSGVVEGACLHLVKDRMECTGMRWSVAGAQAVLEIRAAQINGDWKGLWQHRVSSERARHYEVRGQVA